MDPLIEALVDPLSKILDSLVETLMDPQSVTLVDPLITLHTDEAHFLGPLIKVPFNSKFLCMSPLIKALLVDHHTAPLTEVRHVNKVPLVTPTVDPLIEDLLSILDNNVALLLNTRVLTDPQVVVLLTDLLIKVLLSLWDCHISKTSKSHLCHRLISSIDLLI